MSELDDHTHCGFPAKGHQHAAANIGGGSLPRAVIEQLGDRDVERDANDIQAGDRLRHEWVREGVFMFQRIQ
jgi:hypothetical protein